MVAAVRQPPAASHATGHRPLRGGAPAGRGSRHDIPMRRRLWACALATDNYLLVLLLIVGSILIVALADVAPFPVPLPILFGATLLYALRTSVVAPRLQAIAVVLVFGGMLVALGSVVLTGRTGPTNGIDAGGAALLVVVTAVAIARRLVSHPAIEASTVAGALCIYLLVGLFFSFLFRLTTAVGLGPFFASIEVARAADYLYFSFSTLTTLGYGDLVARTDLGRMLAVTEGLFGQMYLVTVVALLVSNFGRDRHPRAR